MRILGTILLLTPAVAALAAPDSRFDQRHDQVRVSPQPDAVPPPARAAAASVFGPHERLWIVADAKPEVLLSVGVSVEEVRPGRSAGTGNGRMARALEAKGVSFVAAPLAQIFGLDFPPEDAAFRNYERMKAELESIAASAPELASVFSIGATTQSREILALRLNTGAKGKEPSRKPGAVFFGTHHAREHLSTEVPLLIARWLVDNRKKPEIAKLLANRDVYLLPMVNPDGVELDVRDGRYHMHRKNARDNGLGADSLGVDLNRNYGSHWGEAGSSTDPESDTYQGPTPFSEPETQAVKKFVDERPNLKVEVSYHTYSELILYPWSYTREPLDDARAVAAYETMARAMGKMTGYTPEQSSALYPSSGDTCDWSWEAHRIFSFTFELTPKSMRDGGFYPGAAAIQSTFQANLRPALYLIDLADDPYRAADGVASFASPTTGGR